MTMLGLGRDGKGLGRRAGRVGLAPLPDKSITTPSRFFKHVIILVNRSVRIRESKPAVSIVGGVYALSKSCSSPVDLNDEASHACM